MKVYGSDICIDCRNYKALASGRKLEAAYIDITESTLNLREFLHIRDTQPLFDEVRSRGGIGIPLFVHEDGRMTLELDEALAWLGQEPARAEELPESFCGIHGCG